MRTFILLFCTTVFSFNIAISSAQEKVVISSDTEATVDEVFQIIMNQTKYNFLYPEGIFKTLPKVQLKKGVISADKLIQQSLSRGAFNVILSKNNTILIKELKTRQNIEVSGVVSDNNGLPLPGVNVFIKGTKKGTITNFDGSYKITVANPENVLVFTYLGYEQQEIEVGNRRRIDVTFKEKENILDEVVLVGYGTQKRERISSAISTLKSDEIAKTSVGTVSFDRSLQGLIKGVNVVSPTGSTAGNVDINIRGYTSPFSGSDNNPLFVIDGVPFQVHPNTQRNDETRFTEVINPLLAMNPNEIESIDVLKDAAATSIYGSRGANGVIIVNTKKGKYGAKQTISFASNISVSSPIALDKYLSTDDWKIYLDTYFKNTSQAIADGQIINPAALASFQDLANLDANLLYTGLNETNIGKANTNWSETVYRSAAVTKTQNLSIKGGTTATAYLLNLGYTDKEGLVYKDNLKQYNLRLALDSKVNKTLEVGTNLNLGYSKRRLGTFFNEYDGDELAHRPDVPAFDENGNHILRFETDFFGTYPAIGPTPYAIATATSNNTKAYNILGNIYGQLNLSKDLNVKLDLNGGLFITDQYQYSPASILGYFFPLFQASPPTSENSTAYDTHAINSNLTTDLTLNYNKAFGKHSFDGTVGYSWLRESADRTFNVLRGFPDDKVLTNPSNAVSSDNSKSIIYSGLNSLFGRLSYGYDSKYFLTLTVREDKSSKFPDGNKNAVFPSLSTSWNMANEKFLIGSEYINLLRLRASVGKTGSTNIKDFSFLQGFEPGFRTEGTYNGESAIGLGKELANKNVKWEETKEINLGLDFRFFKNRLHGSIDVYNRKTNGALVNTPIPLEIGLRGYTSNFIDLSNKGFEIELGGDLIARENFNWYASINVSQNRNMVENVTSTMADDIRSPYLVGQPINVIRGFKVDGIFQTQAEIDKLNAASPTGNYMATAFGFAGPGDFKYADINNDNIITLDDNYAILGNAEPDFFGGFTSKVTYKGFELSTFFNFVKGGQAMYAEGAALNPYIRANILDRYAKDRWSPTNTNAHWPRLVFRAGSNFNNQLNSAHVYDRSYIRLKNIQLTYNIPQNIIKSIRLTKASCFVSANNIKTWTKEYPGKDPGAIGAGQSGTVFSSYPNAKSINFGLNLNF